MRGAVDLLIQPFEHHMNDPNRVCVPDIGDFADIPILEVRVRAGDTVAPDDTLIVLESDKATLDVPSPRAGTIRELKIAVGDRVSKGFPILDFEGVDDEAPRQPASPTQVAPETSLPPAILPETSRDTTSTSSDGAPTTINGAAPRASPSLRRMARQFGIDLTQVTPSGPRGRIRKEDLQAFVKAAANTPAPSPVNQRSASGLDLIPWPKVDFAAYGTCRRLPLSRIKKAAGANLSRNWAVIPHVTNFDEADVTELDAFRAAMNDERTPSEAKLTLLAFLIKASCVVLKRYPAVNASLDAGELVLKDYFHIGFAVDTPDGLVVPVIRNADTKGLSDLAAESAHLATAARNGKLRPQDMQGGSFTVSSLGGIGGTGFTPIINAPEVAILGATRIQTKPAWNGTAFIPRQMLPLSLSWDHRVIDGALAARFLASLCKLLGDFRRVVL